MKFEDYASAAASTNSEFEHANQLWYLALGLTGESGECADLLKKVYRKYGSIEDAPEDMRTHLLRELGDVLWYLNKMARTLGSSLSEVAAMNIEKLTKRKAKGTLTDASKRDKKDK